MEYKFSYGQYEMSIYCNKGSCRVTVHDKEDTTKDFRAEILREYEIKEEHKKYLSKAGVMEHYKKYENYRFLYLLKRGFEMVDNIIKEKQ